MINTDLQINEQLATDKICSYLVDLVKLKNVDGILLGLSGGIDSALLSTLAVKALGSKAVHVSYLFDRDSELASQRKAKLMSDWLGIQFDVIDITPEMHKKGVYKPFMVRLIHYSQTINRMIQYPYSLTFSETPFKSSLRVGMNEFNVSKFQQFMYNRGVRRIINGFDKRHIYRKEFLSDYARKNNYFLLGAANLSEYRIGWFVKDGIDDLPIQPLTGLYKTQVFQLAKFLELPDVIQNQVPSPDMMKGFTDEMGMGHKYGLVDIVMDYIDQELSDEEIVARGIDISELNDIRDLMRLSAWKRESAHEKPPADGRYGGDIRIG